MAQGKSAFATRQPRFTAGGKLVCAICWMRAKKQSVLNGDPDELRCYSCGTKYQQKPHGLSFNVLVPESIRKEAYAKNGEQFVKELNEAKAKASVVGEQNLPDNNKEGDPNEVQT